MASRLNHAFYQRILDGGFCWTTIADGIFIIRAAQVKKGAALTLHYGDRDVPVVEAFAPWVRGEKGMFDDRQRKLF